MVLNAMISGITLKISISPCSSLAYNTTDFCVLTLKPATLPKSQIISNSFVLYFAVGFSMYIIILSTIKAVYICLSSLYVS